jgi:lysophospholipase L1-like esterase
MVAVAAAMIEDASQLASFKTALARTDRAIRISWFGDSLTADDHMTHSLRTSLGAKLGAGGPGFVFAAPPHPYCQHRACRRTPSEEWTVHGIAGLVPPDKLLGLGGSAETDRGGTIELVPASAVASVDVHYLAEPGGGAIELFADRASIARVATRHDTKASQFLRAGVPADTKRVVLRASGNARLFGITLEAARGAVVDNLGIVNATAKSMHDHDRDDHLRVQLGHRAPDLVIAMYGANEAEWLAPNGSGMAEHEQKLGDVLDAFRSSGAACLVVSPLDQIDWRDPKQPPRASIPAMVEAQRRAAKRAGCAFWNTYAWMGGKGSSIGWHKRGLLVGDFQHPTSEGAALIAEAIFTAVTSV